VYITFIRPILEYGSEVWDNCGAVNSDRLEKVQTEAARIVTGLTSYASLDSMFVSVYCLNKCTIKIKNQVVLLIISTENHNISLTWVKFYKPSF
jgi:hypothetical protein